MAADAITHPDGPLLVLGGPAPGRPTCSRMLAWLVAQGAPAHSGLAIALSPQAAASMLAASRSLAPPYEELHVRTFGTFCERLLRDEAPEAGLAPDFAAVAGPIAWP